jgi:hypothetical protein
MGQVVKSRRIISGKKQAVHTMYSARTFSERKPILRYLASILCFFSWAQKNWINISPIALDSISPPKLETKKKNNNDNYVWTKHYLMGHQNPL